MCPSLLQNDYRMREIMHIAHEFLQNFCRNNTTNQSLLHRKLDLFLQSGDSVSNTYTCIVAYEAAKKKLLSKLKQYSYHYNIR